MSRLTRQEHFNRAMNYLQSDRASMRSVTYPPSVHNESIVDGTSILKNFARYYRTYILSPPLTALDSRLQGVGSHVL
jgi:hypothetical protein